MQYCQKHKQKKTNINAEEHEFVFLCILLCAFTKSDHRSRLSQVHILMEYLALNINLVAFPADMYIYMTYK